MSWEKHCPSQDDQEQPILLMISSSRAHEDTAHSQVRPRCVLMWFRCS